MTSAYETILRKNPANTVDLVPKPGMGCDANQVLEPRSVFADFAKVRLAYAYIGL